MSRLPGGAGTAVLITLDNGHDHSRPNSLGPRGLASLNAAIDAALARDDIAAIAITGKPFIFAAGADLTLIGKITDREQAVAIGRIGHAVFDKLHTSAVPTFTFLNGLALGGGLEIALHCHYRTVSAHAAGIALPECFLGMLPGWGGAYLLPNLIGADAAVTVIIENALNQNRMLTGPQAHQLGIADAIFDGADFLERSLEWAAAGGRRHGDRSSGPRSDRGDGWTAAVARGREIADEKTSGAAPAPYRALELIEQARTAERARRVRRRGRGARRFDHERGTAGRSVRLQPGAEAGQEARRRSGPLVGAAGDQGRHRRRGPDGHPAGAALPAPVRGAGGDLRRRPGAGRPRGRRACTARSTGSSANGGSRPIRPTGCGPSIIGTTDHADYADCDFVLEAVFEEMSVKKDVFASLEKHVSDTCVLATNTSSLSVSEMARRPRASRAGDRLPLLQPGGGAAAARGRPGGRHRRCDRRDGAGGGQAAQEERGAGGRCPGVRVQPAADPDDERDHRGRGPGHTRHRRGRGHAPARPADAALRAPAPRRTADRAARDRVAARGVPGSLPGVGQPAGAGGGQEAGALRLGTRRAAVRLRGDRGAAHRSAISR